MKKMMTKRVWTVIIVAITKVAAKRMATTTSPFDDELNKCLFANAENPISLKKVTKLLKKGANPFKTYGNECALAYAARDGRKDLVEEMVCFDGITFQDRTIQQKIQLYLMLCTACGNEDIDIARFLLEYGVWPRFVAHECELIFDETEMEELMAARKKHKSPLYKAMAARSLDVVYLLLQFGARFVYSSEYEMVSTMFLSRCFSDDRNVLFMLETMRRKHPAHITNEFFVRQITDLRKCEFDMFLEPNNGIIRLTALGLTTPENRAITIKFPPFTWTPDVHALELVHPHPLLILKTIREVLMCLRHSRPEIHWDLQKLLFEFIWGSMFNVFF